MNKTRKRQLEESLADAIAPIVRKPPDKSLIDSLVERYSSASPEPKPEPEAVSLRTPEPLPEAPVTALAELPRPPAIITFAALKEEKKEERPLAPQDVTASALLISPPPQPAADAARGATASAPPPAHPEFVGAVQPQLSLPSTSPTLVAAALPVPIIEPVSFAPQTKEKIGKKPGAHLAEVRKQIEPKPATQKTAKQAAKNKPGVAKVRKAAPAEDLAFEDWLGSLSHFLRGGQRLLVRLIFEHTVSQGREECLLSMPQLAELTGLTERHCYYLLNQLVSMGFVLKGKTYNTTDQRGTAYSLHSPLLQEQPVQT